MKDCKKGKDEEPNANSEEGCPKTQKRGLKNQLLLRVNSSKKEKKRGPSPTSGRENIKRGEAIQRVKEATLTSPGS